MRIENAPRRMCLVTCRRSGQCYTAKKKESDAEQYELIARVKMATTRRLLAELAENPLRVELWPVKAKNSLLHLTHDAEKLAWLHEWFCVFLLLRDASRVIISGVAF